MHLIKTVCDVYYVSYMACFVILIYMLLLGGEDCIKPIDTALRWSERGGFIRTILFAALLLLLPLIFAFCMVAGALRVLRRKTHSES